MKKTLLFHIGFPKTGTSSLQAFLYKNRYLLEEYGWCYLDIGSELTEVEPCCIARKDKNASYFYSSKEDGSLFLDTDSNNWIKCWECIKKYLREEEKNLILSSEDIAYCAGTKILKEAKRLYDNVKVVVYLRRQDKFVESYWNTEVRINGCQKKFTDYVSCMEKDNNDIWSVLFYYDFLEKISRIIGKENVIVRVYEQQQFFVNREGKKDIISDFLSVFNIKNDHRFEMIRRENESVCGEYLEIQRVFNSVLNEYVTKENWECTRGESFFVFGEMIKFLAEEEKKQSYFSSSERIAFLKRFEEQNRLVAKEYLGRKDGNLFYDEEKDYPQKIVEINSFERAMVQVFAKYVCEQNRKIHEMQNSLDKVFEHSVFAPKLKGRKLAYFAAGSMCEDMLREHKFKVELIIDNDKSKDGKYIKGIKAISADNISDWSQYFIIITCMNTEEIEKQLQEYGLLEDEDYILAKNYF